MGLPCLHRDDHRPGRGRPAAVDPRGRGSSTTVPSELVLLGPTMATTLPWPVGSATGRTAPGAEAPRRRPRRRRRPTAGATASSNPADRRARPTSADRPQAGRRSGMRPRQPRCPAPAPASAERQQQSGHGRRRAAPKATRSRMSSSWPRSITPRSTISSSDANGCSARRRRSSAPSPDRCPGAPRAPRASRCSGSPGRAAPATRRRRSRCRRHRAPAPWRRRRGTRTCSPSVRSAARLMAGRRGAEVGLARVATGRRDAHPRRGIRAGSWRIPGSLTAPWTSTTIGSLRHRDGEAGALGERSDSVRAPAVGAASASSTASHAPATRHRPRHRRPVATSPMATGHDPRQRVTGAPHAREARRAVEQLRPEPGARALDAGLRKQGAQPTTRPLSVAYRSVIASDVNRTAAHALVARRHHVDQPARDLDDPPRRPPAR